MQAYKKNNSKDSLQDPNMTFWKQGYLMPSDLRK